MAINASAYASIRSSIVTNAGSAARKNSSSAG